MHIPVLLQETINYLDPKENENFIDATLGQAGHSQEILKRNGPSGKILGIEQ
ncbi:MAG: 16S rRNA (cytosine(1402)-N(4))-methyltransferase, partial [Parcubacteria group bacterium CG23_combo_of_CG06-09_8_20_14_all_35_6]